ncbi:MAG: DUF927 domain-containing protein [Pseudomonadota bacterium]
MNTHAQFIYIVLILLAQRLERIRERERLEQLAKFHRLATLFRRRRSQKWRFTNAYIKFWSQESIKKWYQFFKDLRPAANARQAISVKNPYHPCNANTGIGADVNRSVPVIGTPMPTARELEQTCGEGREKSEGEISSQKVLVLQGAPTCGTKKLFFDEDGNPQKSGARQQSLFTPSQFECKDIQSLAAALQALEKQPDKFIIHGQPCQPLTGQKINRRKYQGNAKMPPSIRSGAQVHYFTGDIDSLPLVDLGYDEKTTITDVTIEQLVEKITEKYLPIFRGVSYYAQFSQSCGWKANAKKIVKMHIWWWLDKKTDLATLKKFAKQINQTVGFQLLDTAIYQETQPIYVATPIFPQGTPDHLPERSKLVVLQKASASLEGALQTTRQNAKSKPEQQVQNPQTFEQWREFFSNIDAKTSLHEKLRSFFFWAIKAKIPEGDFNQIKIALKKSPRIQEDPERLSALLNGEWNNTLNWCKERVAENEKNEESAPLPPGYIMKNGRLHVEAVTRSGKPFWKKVYGGIFRVIGFHRDIDTRILSIELQVETPDGIQNIIVPQNAVLTKSAIIKELGKLGAKVSDKNASLCVDFITDSLEPSYIETLQKAKNTNRLGFHGDTFVLQEQTLGEDSTLKYKGDLVEYVEDQDIYTNTVRTIFNEWGDNAWVAATALGFSLASPFVGRLRIKRNPIFVMTGESGAGKSTLLKFAINAWTSNLDRPFLINGSQPNTPIGFSQNIAGLNGLPCFFDEINRAEEKRGNIIRWGDAAMAFANGQTRIRGSKNSETQAQGGKKITGVLFGAGESLPDCDVEGIYNRQLEINATNNPPLGFEPGDDGNERALLLEDASERGGGVFGGKFVKFVLNKWKNFQEEYEKLRTEWKWRFKSHTAAVSLVVTVLRYLGQLLSVNTTKIIDIMLEKFLNLFSDYQKQENHPANRAMETLRDMIATSAPATRNEGGQLVYLDYYKYGSMPFFWKSDEGDYVIPSTSPLLKQHVGDIRQYFKKWVASGFILPGCKNVTRVLQSKIGPSKARCIVISHKFVDDNPPVAPPVNTTQTDSREQGATATTPEKGNFEKQEKTVDDKSQQIEGGAMTKSAFDKEDSLARLRNIFWNKEIIELPDVLKAIEQLPLPESIWEQLTGYLGRLCYEKHELLRSIAGWVNEKEVRV